MQHYVSVWVWSAACTVIAFWVYRFLNKYIHQERGSIQSSIDQVPGPSTPQSIAVIIPTLREATVLRATVEHIFRNASSRSTNGTHAFSTVSVVVVDASHDSECQAILSPLISTYSTLHSVSYPGKPSRGSQLNFGASHAAKLFPEASILVFLHADTYLPPQWDDLIIHALSSTRQRPVLGCFKLSLPPPLTPSLRIMLWGAYIRTRFLKLPYGDQCFFMTRATFEGLGGFPAVPIMEDLEMVRRVSQRGGTIQVLDQAVETNPRRWTRKGVVWNTILNQVFITAWLCGVSHETIYRWYYGSPKNLKS